MKVEPFISWFQWQKSIFERQNFRFLTVLSGSSEWSRQLAKDCMLALGQDEKKVQVAWLTANKSALDTKLNGTTTFSTRGSVCVEAYNKGQNMLGTSVDMLILEVFEALHPDSMAAAMGCVKGGGAVLLLVNDWNAFPKMDDKDWFRFISYGRHQLNCKDKSSLYLERFKSLCDEKGGYLNERLKTELTPATSSFINIYFEADVSGLSAVPIPSIQQQNEQHTVITLTQDQFSAIDQIKKTVTGHRKRPLVIKSHRGRGKSTTLGIATAQLMEERSCRILVTAPHKQGATELFFWVETFLHWRSTYSHGNEVEEQNLEHEFGDFLSFTLLQAVADGHRNGALDRGVKNFEWKGGCVHFAPADQVAQLKEHYDLLIVDEAAAIPTQLLTEFVGVFKRVVFATTIQGYEGNGRGFELRFEPILNELMPQWRSLTMQQPVRWAEQDPLEMLSDDLFLPILEERSDRITGPISIRTVKPEELIRNEALLRETFTLLVDAHYQTTPCDLRMLLDSDDVVLLLAYKGRSVVGACVVNIEGPFSSEWSEWVVHSGRKLRGHLLPQALIFQFGEYEPLSGVMGRVVRVAVHNQVRREGIGSALLEAVMTTGKERGWSGIGASYGVSAELLYFWLENGFALLRMSVGKDSASGEYSALVVKAIQPHLNEIIFDGANGLLRQFTDEFVFSLPTLYQSLDPKIILLALSQQARLEKGEREMSLLKDVLEKVSRYQQGFLPFELAHLSLQKWFLSLLVSREAIKTEKGFIQAEELIVAKVLQNKDWKECASQFRLPGRKMIEDKLRTWIGENLE